MNSKKRRKNYEWFICWNRFYYQFPVKGKNAYKWIKNAYRLRDRHNPETKSYKRNRKRWGGFLLLNIVKDDYEKLCMRYSAILMYLRMSKGYTEKEVADKIGVTRKAVWNWEHCRTIPSAYSSYMLSLLYGMPYEILCAIPPKKHKKQGILNPVTQVIMNFSEYKLEKYLEQCKEENLGRINVWL